MNIFDWLSSSMIEPTRAKSSSVNLPVRIFQESTARRAQNMRSTSCSLDISREITPIVLPALATFWAMLRARDVLPIDGRAARTIRSDGWRPESMLSRDLKPVGVPRYFSLASGSWRSEIFS